MTDAAVIMMRHALRDPHAQYFAVLSDSGVRTSRSGRWDLDQGRVMDVRFIPAFPQSATRAEREWLPRGEGDVRAVACELSLDA